MLEAFQMYINKVNRGEFPQSTNVRNMKDEEKEKFMKWYTQTFH